MEGSSSKHALNKPIFYLLSILVLLIIRVFINTALPLMDKTEARYAEIARIMSETNHWVTLQIDYNIPFWAKPPLSTWLSAFSINLFGVTEFAVRLPSLIFAILIFFVIGKYSRQQGLPFFLPAFILLTIPEFLLHTGVVSTDMSLCFCIVLTMLSFWESSNTEKRTAWNYLFFIGIGLGLLAKGPIIIILTLPPLFLWLLFFKDHIKVITKMPWLIGILIIGIISVPWYYLAEKATPGFWDYFIVGEHFKRFLDSSWSGDKYGFPKSQPIGMIWVFLILFTLPWITLVIKKVWNVRLNLKTNKWLLFLILWLLWTPFFFTLSKSLIHPYIMPVMIPLALLIVFWWRSIKWQKTYLITSLMIPVIAVILFSISLQNKSLEFYSKTDKYLLKNKTIEGIPIYHLHKKSYSSGFYSNGKIKLMTSNQFNEALQIRTPFLILISHRDTLTLKNEQKTKLKKIQSNKYKSIYSHQ
ncbi:ArnT family glycosyltransferase [Flavivirga rizhaonensis]|uniref:Phospholipid carrier-dependent glycosyltransferase n=1 Tax=Flavivirga rizhaonensis TaxID=2559571 RepID=A0A4S1E4B9_9FLAO|nr:phospholipid carrier-dependent glycosyltransferase [Flavivirga rizhaonensis]TGV04862.1 phospholipid carrier-dependent glycosyltransferase [Flavivirga rizhaonensis]